MLINKRGRANDYSPLLAYEVRRHYYVFERVFRTKCVVYKPFFSLEILFLTNVAKQYVVIVDFRDMARKSS